MIQTKEIIKEAERGLIGSALQDPAYVVPKAISGRAAGLVLRAALAGRMERGAR